MEIVVAHQDGGIVRLGGSNRLADFALAGGKFDVDDVDDAWSGGFIEQLEIIGFAARVFAAFLRASEGEQQRGFGKGAAYGFGLGDQVFGIARLVEIVGSELDNIETGVFEVFQGGG